MFFLYFSVFVCCLACILVWFVWFEQKSVALGGERRGGGEGHWGYLLMTRTHSRIIE